MEHARARSADFAEELDEHRARYAADMGALALHHAAELDAQQAQHAQQLADLNERLDAAMAQLEATPHDQHNESDQPAASPLDTAESSGLEARLIDMQEEHAVEICALEERHAADVAAIICRRAFAVARASDAVNMDHDGAQELQPPTTALRERAANGALLRMSLKFTDMSSQEWLTGAQSYLTGRVSALLQSILLLCLAPNFLCNCNPVSSMLFNCSK